MIASLIPLLALLGLLITLASSAIGLVQGMEQVVPAPLSVNALVDQFAVPNVVTPIVLDLRLYDTVGEVIVFTLASMGVHHLLKSETAEQDLKPAEDEAAVVLFRLGAILNTLIAVELAVRGHLSPGGGFAAGVAGGTALALVLLFGGSAEATSVYRRIHAETLEESAVLIFIVLSLLLLEGFNLPLGEYGTVLSGGLLPVLNVLVGVKVTLGSWGMIQRFLTTNQLH